MVGSTTATIDDVTTTFPSTAARPAMTFGTAASTVPSLGLRPLSDQVRLGPRSL